MSADCQGTCMKGQTLLKWLYAMRPHHNEGQALKASTMREFLSIDMARTTFLVGVMGI